MGFVPGIIIALNINVDSIAVAGLCSSITFKTAHLWITNHKRDGDIAKYLATSFSCTECVMAPCVISNCLPSFTTFNIFDGSESQSTPCSASFFCSHQFGATLRVQCHVHSVPVIIGPDLLHPSLHDLWSLLLQLLLVCLWVLLLHSLIYISLLCNYLALFIILSHNITVVIPVA